MNWETAVMAINRPVTQIFQTFEDALNRREDVLEIYIKLIIYIHLYYTEGMNP